MLYRLLKLWAATPFGASEQIDKPDINVLETYGTFACIIDI